MTKTKEIELFITEVEHPLDGRRRAYIQTNNEYFIKKVCIDVEGKLTCPIKVYLKEDVDKHFVRKKTISPDINLVIDFEPSNKLIINGKEMIEKQKVKDAYDDCWVTADEGGNEFDVYKFEKELGLE